MKTAAQRAAKRLRRELRKGPVVQAPDHVPGGAKFHRFYLPSAAKADEMVRGFVERGRTATVQPVSGELGWQVRMRANQPEIVDHGLFVDKYREFAEMFDGEYGGML